MNTPEQSLTPSPPPRVGPLNTMTRVREEMARVYKQARRGELSTSDASRLTFILSAIARLIEGSDLEQRLVGVERALQERSDHHESHQAH